MSWVWCVLGLLSLCAAVQAGHQHHVTTTPRPRTPEENMHYQLDELEKLMESVARQLMLQQLYFNERTRTMYNTGIKQIRYTKVGSRPYDSEAHSGPTSGAVHDHPEQYATVGLGEVDAVMNGIDFRTRHNDYKLKMPGNRKRFHDERDVPLPNVPHAVTKLSDTSKQVQEMREWFHAWQNGNSTHRPFTSYFKPVLCYMEGAFLRDLNSVREPTPPAKHHLNALNQREMENKIKFSGQTGLQDFNEDLAYLPRYIMNVFPRSMELARWNYRIACHPLKQHLPLEHLHVVDDLSARVANNQTMGQYLHSPAARFRLHEQTKDKEVAYSLMDKLMHEVPGKDNYGSYLEDDIEGEKLFTMRFQDNYTLLNTAYYHRLYRVNDKGAMGVKDIHKGFADSSLFVAQTNISEVSSMTWKNCKRNHKTHHIECHTAVRKYSFAIPLEVIYLTPLHKWNPYNILYKNDADSTTGKTVTANHRHGGLTKTTAFDGTNSRLWYQTPKEFFDLASLDYTDKRVVGVLDPSGSPREVMASGIRTVLPRIPGLPPVRTRYPLYPVHGEGLGEWKELNALKDIAMKIADFTGLYEHNPISENKKPSGHATASVKFVVGNSDSAHGSHTHEFVLNFNKMETIGAGIPIVITTSVDAGHSHKLVVFFHPGTSTFEIKSCDGKNGPCSDGHPVQLSVVPI